MSTSLCAQEKVVVEENFVDNNRYWPLGNFEYATVAISKKRYIIDRIVEGGESVFTIDNFIDPSQPFSIETEFVITNAIAGGYAGLVWNYLDLNNFDAFVIAPDGTFRVLFCRMGNFIEVSGVVKHEAVNTQGKSNRLTVQRKGNAYEYFVNGTPVYRSRYTGITYSAQGFYLIKKIGLSAGSFLIGQQQTIRTAEEFIAEKENPGTAINSEFNERAPLISPDGSVLFYIRDKGNEDLIDIRMSTLNAAGEWTPSISLDPVLNNNQYNSVVSVAADNKSILLLKKKIGFQDLVKGTNFCISRYAKGRWTAPEEIVIPQLNSLGKWMDASLSVDNRTLIISVLRPGTMGYNDLYVSFLSDQGTWSVPLNLGPSVNTPFNEAAPFLAADNKTLYFSSLGYPGYGNQDIFMCKRLDDSWTNWSAPLNLGPKVNTKGFDAFFSVTANEPWAYLVSNTNAIGGFDVFRIKLPSVLSPAKVCILSGKVLDNSNSQALAASLVYRSLSNERVKGTIYSDEQNGNYQIMLPDTGTYYISAYKEGYYARADTVVFSETSKKHTLRLDPLVVGKSLEIRQLYFEQSKADLLPSSEPALEQLRYLLESTPKLKIQIEGHTDNVGDALLNKQLSLARAEAVKRYLIEQGIDKNRITTKGYGSIRPVADNNQEETRKLNRRVEFSVIEK